MGKKRQRRIALTKFIGFIFIFTIVFIGCNKFLDGVYEKERNHISTDDLTIINQVIELAKEKVGLEYVWGGKGEIMTEERLNELISWYGIEYYPLKKEEYIGNQAFDCSGLIYWVYKEITDVFIGYSTTEQQEMLSNYKVSWRNLQPGDIIFTPGHVVMYIGDGKIINSSNKKPYPSGGIKIERIGFERFADIYRPIDYIKDIKAGI